MKANRKNSSACLAEAKSPERKINEQVYIFHRKYVTDIAALVTVTTLKKNRERVLWV